MAESVHLAVDLGASGGRVVAGVFDGAKLHLEEIHRFANGPIRVQNSLHWNVLGLWSHLLDGLRAAAHKYGDRVASVGVDSWGVDYGLVGPGDELLGNPYHYRDPRTDGVMEEVFEIVPKADVFAATGVQFMGINTLYQLVAQARHPSRLLQSAERLLMIPDLFHWLLTGVRTNERTNASTTQCYNPLTGKWAFDLLEQLDVPTDLLGDLVDAGSTIGLLSPGVAAETGLKNVKVILPGTHDTASAVAAAPAAGKPGAAPDWAYISSGTWALMGIETPQPIVNDEVLRLNFTNEAGVGGTTRLLKNITGLWLVQECRRAWALQGTEYTWEGLTHMAQQEAPLVSLIDPDHPDFAAPTDMPTAIREYCRRTHQPVPESPGRVVRCALESIALRCRYVLNGLEQLAGAELNTLHIVGGGVQNRLLCQMISNACVRPVWAGPVEATALGNVLVQLVSSGRLGSLSDARTLVRQSFPLTEYTPRDIGAWDDAFLRFEVLLS